MRKKLPAHIIFNILGKKTIAILVKNAKKSGWDQPLQGKRYYSASSLMKSIIIYQIKDMSSLDALVAHFVDNAGARKTVGLGKNVPSKSTFSRFIRFLGPQPFENLFRELLEILKKKGLVKGRHIAIDSTHIKAWSQRKSKDKKSPLFKFAKNCTFARLGMTPKGFMLCYRVQTATLTKSGIPVAVKVFPGNTNDKKAFEVIFRSALKQVPSPLAVSADKGYSSAKNRRLIEEAGAASIIRPPKSEVEKKGMEPFLPKGMSEKTFWVVYPRRNTVELTFAQTKQHCGLRRPRVTEKDPIKQHVFLSFVIHQLLTLASAALGLTKTCFSKFI